MTIVVEKYINLPDLPSHSPACRVKVEGHGLTAQKAYANLQEAISGLLARLVGGQSQGWVLGGRTVRNRPGYIRLDPQELETFKSAIKSGRHRIVDLERRLGLGKNRLYPILRGLQKQVKTEVWENLKLILEISP